MNITKEEAQKRITKATDGNVIIKGDFVNVSTKTTLKCTICGYEWKNRPRLSYRSKYPLKCPKCFGKLRDTAQSTRKKVYISSNHKISMVGMYRGTSKKTLMHCNVCGYEWLTEPISIYSGRHYGCRKCAGLIKMTQSEFENRVKDIYGSEIIVLGKYVNSGTKIKLYHTKCGNAFLKKPNDIFRSKCPYCAPNRKLSNDEFKKRLKELFKGEYIPLQEYKNMNTKIMIKHTKCGHSWKANPDNLMHAGSGCPYCNQSRGEKAVYSWLKERHIKFKTQYWIKECKNLIPLPFDFAVFGDNGELLSVIEFQGVQHYKNWVFDDTGNNSLEARKARDKIKKDFCNKNGINFIEVINKKASVSHYMMNKIVDNELSKHFSTLRPNQAS